MLGWEPSVDFKELVHMMVDADLERLSRVSRPRWARSRTPDGRAVRPPMTVGLVIVTYNAAAFIGRALAAVAAQTRPPDDVVIIDNASSDGTCRAIEQATAGWSIPGARGAGRRAISGLPPPTTAASRCLPHCDVIALLNPDAFPEPGWLAALLAAAEAHPDAGSFASRLMLDGKPGRLDGVGDVCHVSGLVWRHAHDRPERDVPEAGRSGPVFSACAAAALYRRDDWVRVGGLDERFFCYVEDVDLGFRLQLAGRPCRYVADAVVHHLGSASAGVGSDFAVYHGHRNLEWLFLKNMPAPLLWRYLPLHLLTWPLLLVWFTARGRGVELRAREVGRRARDGRGLARPRRGAGARESARPRRSARCSIAARCGNGWQGRSRRSGLRLECLGAWGLGLASSCLLPSGCRLPVAGSTASRAAHRASPREAPCAGPAARRGPRWSSWRRSVRRSPDRSAGADPAAVRGAR